MLFARDLLINMAPWLLACVLATALQAKCLQVGKGNCKWMYNSTFVYDAQFELRNSGAILAHFGAIL